jgi:hypothetical protein
VSASALKLPIVVGVTGHRDIRPEDEATLTAAVRGIFERLRARYPRTPLLLLTPLAAGADRLVARVAVAEGIPYRVPMPLPENEYRKDFGPAEDAEFSTLLVGAQASFAMPFAEGNTSENVDDPDRRARQYATAGAYIAGASHVLIALWDGKHTDTVGGTAQIVTFRLLGAPAEYRGSDSLLDAPESGPVYHVVASRRSNPATLRPIGEFRVLLADRTIAEADDPFKPLYRRIEEFNRDCDQIRPKISPNQSATFSLREMAEQLATYYQGKFHRALNRIFLATAAATVLLSLFAHLLGRDQWLVFPYALFMLAAGATYFRAARGRWQDRFLEYRALEISLTVQRSWDLAGVRCSVADYYLRRQRSELDWIREAVRTWHRLEDEIAFDPEIAVEAVHDFVAEQREFFSRVARRDHGRSQFFESAATASLLVGFFFSFLLLAVSIVHVFADTLLQAGMRGLAGALHQDLRNVALITEMFTHDVPVAAIAIITIFAALLRDYPRRRAYHEQARRYAVMFAMYDRALHALLNVKDQPRERRLRVAQDVVLEIGREALAENGDWVLMHRELPIELLRV